MKNISSNKLRTLRFDAIVSDAIIFTEQEKFHAFKWSPSHLRFIWHEDTNLMGISAKVIHYEQQTLHPTLVIHVDHAELNTHRLYNGFKSWLTQTGVQV